MRIFPEKRYLAKIIFYVFCVSIIPVVITGYLLYDHFQKIYTDELLSNEQNRTEHYADLLTRQLDTLQSEISAYRTNQMLTPDVSSSWKFKNYLRNQMLNELTSGNLYLNSICYIDINSQKALLTGYGSFSTSHPYIQSLLTFTKDIQGVQVLFFITDNMSNPAIGQDTDKNMYFGYSISDETSKNYAVFEIDYQSILSSIIKQTGLNTEMEEVLLLDSSGNILYPSSSNLFEAEQLTDYIDMSLVEAGEGYQSGDYHVTAGIINKYEGLYIVSIKNVQTYYEKVNILKSQIYFLLASILLLLILAVVMLVYLLYKPILSLMNYIKKFFINDQSSHHTEFDTMMATMKKAVFQIHSLESDLQNSHLNMREVIIRSQLTMSSPISKENQELFKDLPHYFAVSLIQIKDVTLNEKDMKISHIIELIGSKFHYDCFIDEQYGLICVIWLSHMDPQKLSRQLNQMLLSDPVLKNTRITIGNIFKDLQQIRTSYVQAIYTMDCLADGAAAKDLVVPYESTDEIRLSATLEVAEKIAGDVLTLAYLQQDTKKLTTMVRSQLSPENNIIDQYSFLISAYNLILSTCSDYVEKMDAIIKFGDMLQLDKKALPGMSGLLLEYLIKTDMPIHAIDKSTEYFTTIIHYIEEHYNQDIPLDTLAKLVGITPQYLCQIVKRHTGVSFTQYINTIRIEKSKKIILSGEITQVDKLYKLVGFNSQSYFTKVFKNIAGMSPGLFIKRYT